MSPAPANIRLRADAVAAYCAAQNISNSKLCRRMDVDPTTLWSIKEGRRDPSPKFIAALMRETDLDFDALFQIVEAVA